jgi:hypothetical protein
MEWYKKLFLIYKVSDIGIEQKPFWGKKGELTSWINIKAYKIKSTLHGFRGILQPLFYYTGHFVTKHCEVIVIRYMRSPKEGYLFPLKERLLKEVIDKIRKDEYVVFTINKGIIRLKKDVVEINGKTIYEKFPVNSIKIRSYHDGIKILDENGKLLFKTKSPFYNSDILIDAVDFIKGH